VIGRIWIDSRKFDRQRWLKAEPHEINPHLFYSMII